MAESNSTRTVLDIHKLAYTPEGVQDFYWPVALSDIKAVRQSLGPALTALIRQAEGRLPGAVELKVLSHYLIIEAMVVFRGHALAEKLRAEGREPVFQENFHLWRALFEQTCPPMPGFVSGLQAAFPPKDLRYYAKKHWGKLKKKFGPKPAPKSASKIEAAPACTTPPQKPAAPKGFRIRSRRLTGAILRDGIVATRRDSIINLHAQETSAESGREVVLAQHVFWFRPVPTRKLELLRGKVIDNDLREAVVELVRAAFEAGGTGFPCHVRTHFEGYVDTAAALIALHLLRLRKNPERLPKTLWTGTCGNVWDRMLRLAVREAGGRVSAHSHAGGTPDYVNPVYTASEFLACDEYAAYNEREAELLSRHADPRFLLEPIPEMKIVPVPPLPAPEPKDLGRSKNRPAILYLGNFILGREATVSHPFFSDLTAVDWQARLISRLTNAGHEVLFKEHPNNYVPAPEEYASVCGATMIREGCFEDLLDMGDVYLFDNRSSTTFNVAVKTKKPIVFIDFGLVDFIDDARELLARRCAVVEGRLDAENRAQIDWDELREAIRRAPELTRDTAFLKAFYP